MQFPIVIEEPTQAGETFSAYAPDFDGVVATGTTAEACAARMTEALALHIRGMIEDGDPVPDGPRSVRMVEPVLS